MERIICLILVLSFLYTILFVIYKLIKDDILELKKEKLKNDLFEIYSNIDIVSVEKIIDDKLDKNIHTWVLKNITSQSNDEQYIKSEEVETLINYVSLEFVTNISDLYLFYVKCLTNIDDEEDLLLFIREKVKLLVLDFVTKFNS